MNTNTDREPQARPSSDPVVRERGGGLGLPHDEDAAENGCESGDSGVGDFALCRANRNDVPAIGQLYAMEARLQERLGGYALTDPFDWTSWVAVRLQAPEHCFLVARRGTAVVGYVHGRMRVSPDPARAPVSWGSLPRALSALLRWGTIHRSVPPASVDGWGIIESVYVVESERRRGLARRMVSAVKSELATRGVARIEISVMAANEAATRFWSNLGFQPFRAHLVSRIDPRGG